MTLIKDTYDEWTETTYNYIRDQLRSNSVIGIGRPNGAKQIEVGEVTGQELSQHPENTPSIWIMPGPDTPRRTGNTIEHTIQVKIRVFGVTVLQPTHAFMDHQAAHRVFAGKVWNEVLHLRDAMIAACHVDDWWPSGDIDPLILPIAANQAVLGAEMTFSFLRDVIWIQEGV